MSWHGISNKRTDPEIGNPNVQGNAAAVAEKKMPPIGNTKIWSHSKMLKVLMEYDLTSNHTPPETIPEK